MHKRRLNPIFFQKGICSPLTAKKLRRAGHFQLRFKTPSTVVTSQAFLKACANSHPCLLDLYIL